MCCKLLCLHGKSLPELSQGAKRRQLQAGQVFAPIVSSNTRGRLAPGHVAAVPQHPCVGRCSCPSLRRGTGLRQDKRFAQGCPLESTVTMAVFSTRWEHPPWSYSAPCTLSGDVSGPSTASQESWIHPWPPSASHCPRYLSLPIRRVIYPRGTCHKTGSHLWQAEMPQRSCLIPPIVINSSRGAPGAATSCVHVRRLTGCSGLSPSMLF